MDVVMGLLAAVLWGATDFLVGVNARAVGIRRAVFFGQVLGLLLMGVIVSISANQLEKVLVAPASALLIGGVAALCTVLGALSLSKAFAMVKPQSWPRWSPRMESLRRYWPGWVVMNCRLGRL